MTQSDFMNFLGSQKKSLIQFWAIFKKAKGSETEDNVSSSFRLDV